LYVKCSTRHRATAAVAVLASILRKMVDKGILWFSRGV